MCHVFVQNVEKIDCKHKCKHVVREMLFVLTFLLQEMPRASQRTTIVLSCLGPGATLPSCRFRGGQRLEAPETCSACARTGSPSTATSTTTRWAKDHSVPRPGPQVWRGCCFLLHLTVSSSVSLSTTQYMCECVSV